MARCKVVRGLVFGNVAHTAQANMCTRTRRSILVMGIGSSLALLAGCVNLPLLRSESRRLPTIGILRLGTADGAPQFPYPLPFERGLLDLGYVENENLLIARRSAVGNIDNLPAAAAELVQLPVDVIVATDGATIRPAKEATTRIPIVMIVVGDPVRTGCVASLSHPGGNITGLSISAGTISGKRLELLKEIVPGLTRVSAMVPPDNDEPPFLRQAARDLKLDLYELPVTSRAEIGEVIESATLSGAQALVVLGSAVTNNSAVEIVARVGQKRLPAMFPIRGYVPLGGLMAYGASIDALQRRAATYVDKILKGSSPSDLPIELPTTFDFAVNIRTLESLGLSIPQSASTLVTEWVP